MNKEEIWPYYNLNTKKGMQKAVCLLRCENSHFLQPEAVYPKCLIHPTSNILFSLFVCLLQPVVIHNERIWLGAFYSAAATDHAQRGEACCFSPD